MDRCKLTKARGVMAGFSRWLVETGLVEKPPGEKAARLEVYEYEQYVARFRKTRSVKDSRIIQIHKELGGFHAWLKDHGIRRSVRFPLPEETVKGVAAYVIGTRPEKAGRYLFVSLSPPHNPVTGGLVSYAIAKVMLKAEVPGTPYWFRHTHGQNLLRRVGGATGMVGSAFRKKPVRRNLLSYCLQQSQPTIDRRCTHPT